MYTYILSARLLASQGGWAAVIRVQQVLIRQTKMTQLGDHVRRVREKLPTQKGDTPLDTPTTKKEQRRREREALRKQVLTYCDEDGYIRTPIPNDLFVEC